MSSGAQSSICKRAWCMNLFFTRFARYIGTKNFIRRSLRYRIFEKLTKNLDFEVKFYGYKYKGNLSNYIDRSVFFFGAHEREQINFSKKYINCGVVVDCGSNAGNHSLFYSAFGKKVISIEANPVLAEEFQGRIFSNNITNITLLNIGVGSSDGTVQPFYQSTGDNRGVSSFIENFSPQNSNKINVTIRTLDSILSEHKVIKVDFIKIDVEGLDYEVLKGANKIISTSAPVIQFEYLPRDKNKMLDFLIENPKYQAKTLIVNRPFFIFNRPQGKLVEFDTNLRSEVFLFHSK